jgi:hypothetical protein
MCVSALAQARYFLTADETLEPIALKNEISVDQAAKSDIAYSATYDSTGKVVRIEKYQKQKRQLTYLYHYGEAGALKGVSTVDQNGMLKKIEVR